MSEESKKVPHGMRVKVFSEKQEAIILCFASVARCPALRERMKTIDNLDWELGKVARKSKHLALEAEGLHADFVAEDEKKNASARKKLQALMDEGEVLGKQSGDLSDAREDAVSEFYRCSMAGAGYSPEVIEENLTLLTTDQYGEIRSVVRTGCGYVDFTKERAV